MVVRGGVGGWVVGFSFRCRWNNCNHFSDALSMFLLDKCLCCGKFQRYPFQVRLTTQAHPERSPEPATECEGLARIAIEQVGACDPNRGDALLPIVDKTIVRVSSRTCSIWKLVSLELGMQDSVKYPASAVCI